MDLKYIKQNADIVQVIGHFVDLKKDGANFKGRSPFNDERTPSFTVSRAKGIFKDFSSGKGGDVIDFVKEVRGITLKEAAEWVSNFLNMGEQPNEWKYVPPPILPTSYFKEKVLERTLTGYENNNFVQFLLSKFTQKQVQDAVKIYKIGTCKYQFKHEDFPDYIGAPGAVIFWQIDKAERIRSGKVMLYNPQTGKRIKQPFPHIIYAHKAFYIKGFRYEYCHFGQHLVSIFPEKEIRIVESEKTAIIASILYPKCIWIATTGSTLIMPNSCKYMAGRDVTFIPDTGMELQWEKAIKTALADTPCNWRIKQLPGPQPKGYDLCDFIIDSL